MAHGLKKVKQQRFGYHDIDALPPRPKKAGGLIYVALLLRRLEKMVRYQMYNRLFDQNVSAHSHHVASLALLLCETLNQKFDTKLDRDEVLRYAIIHDWEEAIISDIPKGIKNRHPEIEETVDKFAQEGMHEMMGGMGINPSALLIDYQSRSWKFVKLIDAMEALVTTWREASFGNIDMQGVNREIQASISDSVKEFFEDNKPAEEICLEIVRYFSI